MTYLPWTISLITESKVALDRITKYLIAEDIQLEHIKTEENGESDTAIKVQNGNFYWLTEEEKVKKKEKEKEEKKEEEKKKEEGKDKKKKKKAIEEKKIEDEKSISSGPESIVVSSQNNQVNLDPENQSPQDLESDPEKASSSASTGYKLILEDINLNIKKGSFVAILGE